MTLPLRMPPPGTTHPAVGRSAVPGVRDAGASSRLPPVVLLYLLCLLAPVTLTLGPLYLTGLRLLLLLLILPLLLQLVRGRMGGILATDILFLLHVVWVGVALQTNNPNQAMSQIGSVGPEFLGGYLIARAHIRTRADFIALARMLGLICILVLPFVIYESRTGRALFIALARALPVVGTYSDVNPPTRLGLNRAQGMFVNPIHFGLFCSTALALTVVGMRGVLPPWRVVLGGIAVLLCVFFSLSSGALLATVMQIILIAWFVVFRGTGRPWLLLLLVFAATYVIVDILSTRPPVRVFLSYATFSSHTAYWRAMIFDWGMKSVWANPFLGIGLNDWARPWFMFSGSMDNFWLVMAVRYGIPGFAFLAVGYLLGLWRVGCRDLGADPVLLQLRRAWIFTMVGLTFTLCTVHIWTNVYSFVFFLFGTGMWMISLPATITVQESVPDTGPEVAARTGRRTYSRFPRRHSRPS